MMPDRTAAEDQAMSGRNFWSYLDSDPTEAVRQYNRIRERLVFYFTRYGFADPENLASEVVFRVNKKCREGAPVESGLMNFCYGVARFVRLENLGKLGELQTDDFDYADPVSGSPDNRILLGQLLGRLADGERELIRGFYLDDNTNMEKVTGGSRNALRIKVCRVMDKLRDLARKSDNKYGEMRSE